ncbi:MAG TPA: SUMF1/EgtB/PvdO family nonheme iron enzyme [Candidatus Paceibacterota bacterium]|nr:SUMF1/EgtB/PvdO family nonheme iron enzyme [Candidatus Paceibacterota bacterium]
MIAWNEFGPGPGRGERRPLSPSLWPETWTNPRDGSVLRLIPAGPFIMGSTHEQIVAAAAMDVGAHPDNLLHEMPRFTAFAPDYYLAVHPLTNAQFAAFLSAVRPRPAQLARWAPTLERILPPDQPGRPYRVAHGFEQHPAVHLSWFGAEAYCRWAGLRLPTEIEWEKGARGTDGRIFPWGNQWRDEALRWHGGDRREEDTTVPVDAFPSGRSPYGLLQMAGNVDEWCADWFQWNVYQRYAQGDFRPPPTGEQRVVRGGTCLRFQRHHFRCAMRRGNDPAIVNILYLGVRCACDPPPTRPGKGTPLHG